MPLSRGQRQKISGRRLVKKKGPWKQKFPREDQEVEELEARILAETPEKPLSSGPEARSQDGPVLTSTSFSELPISQRTIAGLTAANFIKMTDIQQAAIPRALRKHDLLAEARTGSGKTLAFVVPLVELLYRSQMECGLGGLIIAPTRELSHQTFEVLKNVAAEHTFPAGCTVGGCSFDDEKDLVDNVAILVATPGRLLQHLDQNSSLDVSYLQMLILDEADRVLDFGFQETLNHIIKHLPRERQSLLFSATLHRNVRQLGIVVLKSPEIVGLHSDTKICTPQKLRQGYMVFPLEQKIDILFSFMRSHSWHKMIVFVSSCKQVRFLYETFRLLKPGMYVMEIHGRQSIQKRLATFEDFKSRRQAAAIFCTDIASRGVDFPAVDWVVQVDCPDGLDSYIHRVGRTARLESSGHSLLFLLPSEKAFIAKLKAARIDIKEIFPKSEKTMTVKGKISDIVASSAEIKWLGQKAFKSYIRSIHLMKDKTVFDVHALSQERYAKSLGLIGTPAVSIEVADSHVVQEKKRKNTSSLHRLKEKIRANKLAKAEASASKAHPETGKRNSEVDAGLLVSQPKTLQVKREMTMQPSKKTRLTGTSEGAAHDSKVEHAELPVKPGQTASNFAQLAEEFNDAQSKSQKKRTRQEFLAQVSQDLAQRDAIDAHANRERLRAKHRKRKRKDEDGHNEAEDGVQVVLGTASSPSMAPSSPPCVDPSNAEKINVKKPNTKPIRKKCKLSETTSKETVEESMESKALRIIQGGGLFG